MKAYKCVRNGITVTYLLANLSSCMYWKFGVSFPLLAIIACGKHLL